MGTVLGIWGVSQLGISFSFDRFYPKSDPEVQFYEQYQKLFSDDQNMMIYVALESPTQDIFNQKFLLQADTLFRSLSTLPGVDTLFSATEASQLYRSGLGLKQRPYLEFDSEQAVSRSRKRVLQDSSLTGLLISRDRKYLCALVRIYAEIADIKARDELSEALEMRLQASGLNYVLSGVPHIRSQYVNKIANELMLFTLLSILLIVSVLYVMFRNIWGIVIPIGTVLIALLWTLGLMGGVGESVDLISNLLIPIVFVVGMSDVVHLFTRYLQEREKGLAREIALKNTLNDIGAAIFLTSATTAVGFASLMISKIYPIRMFGLFAAAGVLFAYLVSIILLPNMLIWLGNRKIHFQKGLAEKRFWTSVLTQQSLFIQNPMRIRMVIAGFSILIFLSAVYIPKIPTDTFLLEDIGPRDPIRKSMEFFEENAYGLRPFEMAVQVKPGYHITDKAVLEQMLKVQEHLEGKGDFSPFLSLASVLRELNYIEHFRREQHYRLPDSQVEIDDFIDGALLSQASEALENLYQDSMNIGRISARMPDIGGEAFGEITADLAHFYQTSCDTTLFSYKVTGQAHLTDRNLIYLRSSLLLGLVFAFGVIGVMLGGLFQSLRMTLISMIPNMIPLILTGGVMGAFGIPLTASTAIVFVIAFGIAVDDTIHFLSRYRSELQHGLSQRAAIQTTIVHTGKAMIITSCILIAGFVMLLASDFGGTLSTGLFTALTIVFALLADLYLLPVLLLYFHHPTESGEDTSTPLEEDSVLPTA